MPPVYNSNKVFVFGAILGVVCVALFLGFVFNAFNPNKSGVTDQTIRELSEKAITQSLSMPSVSAATATPEERKKVINTLSASATPSVSVVATEKKSKETQKIIDSLSVPH